MKEILEALTKLLELLFRYFSPNTILFLIIAAPLLLFLYKIYSDWVKRSEVSATVKAKDETIQVLNEHNRQLRVIELESKGWSVEAIEAVIMKETPKDTIEARELVKRGKKKKGNSASNNE